jgi:hypothetical protein
MKILIIWDHATDELFGATCCNDDEAKMVEREMKDFLTADLEIYLYTPETHDALLSSIKECNP